MATPNQLEIVNTALALIGHSPLTSLDTQSGDAARLLYNAAVRHFLSEHEWRFALRQADLSGSQATPSATSLARSWDYEYNLPQFCLRGIGFTNTAEFEIYGNKIFTNADIESDSEVYFIYIHEVSEQYFPAYFTGALVYRLASNYARSIARSNSDADALEAMFRREQAIAKHRDSQSSFNNSLEAAVVRLLYRASTTRP